MDRETELAIVRRAYAKQIMVSFSVAHPRVEAAFAAVRREDFLGPGPWPIARWGRGYAPTPSDDPVYLYQDVLVGLVPERNLNNGQPTYHAMLPTQRCFSSNL
jgi:protein-L-isoaspartate(D-aspartate) O-methyltransferase